MMDLPILHCVLEDLCVFGLIFFDNFLGIPFHSSALLSANLCSSLFFMPDFDSSNGSCQSSASSSLKAEVLAWP